MLLAMENASDESWCVAEINWVIGELVLELKFGPPPSV